ncbi:glycosyltransferase family A protein [Chitinispirillales bacterium ANBcel5]|uniref:glycosyltransferase family 2 protein n=1 Tax=Cellulosispirillum alkaliphilum TaxID=3039283 RepID=UPI002A555029|nr:glycosyltransferase family A protein [Chitinispirillales bacterium ANBcel5]
MPRISVIIPVYNRAKLISRAVDSVLKQSYKDFELIVVDDGSSDDTLKQLRDYKSVTVLSLDTNSGVSAARNFGVAHSCGEWIAFLDSDDEWKPEKLKEQLEWSDQHKSCTIFQSQELWVRKGVRVNPPRSHLKRDGDLFGVSLHRCMISPSCVMIKRTLFDAHGGFDETLRACEDYDLWLRIALKEKVGLVNKVHLVRYGGHSDQLSSSTPCQDKLRICALQKLLGRADLSAEKRTAVKKVIEQKATIVANGALKRGHLDDYRKYASIADAV